MKNGKRIAAILGVVLLLAVFCLPMVFALTGGDHSAGLFRASLGAVILVPVMAYVFQMVYRLLNRKEKEKEDGMKNIIFDVGQVLIRFDWQGYLKSFGFPEEEYQRIAENVFMSQEWNERDRGLLKEEDYVRHFMEAVPEYAEDVRRVMKDSDRTIIPQDYAQTWVRYLKEKGYRLYILSNFCEYILERTRARMSFLEYMDGVVFSCEVKQIKPEEDIYVTLLERFGLDPAESVFLDDRTDNCETARRLGIHAIEFRDFRQAAAELEKLGVK